MSKENKVEQLIEELGFGEFSIQLIMCDREVGRKIASEVVYRAIVSGRGVMDLGVICDEVVYEESEKHND